MTARSWWIICIYCVPVKFITHFFFCKARVPVRALPSNLLTSNLYFYECFMKNAATPSNSSQTKRDLLLCNPDFLTNELTKKRFFCFSWTSVPPQSRVRGGSRRRVQGVRTSPPPSPEISCGFLIQLVFCKKNYVVYWRWSRARDECTPS